ncbi:hypothetical protein [Nesterenkonia haasae]|uniref:hypothetical protein n=1 Tax=Nesterenkonia haasae TaxID=2587813 RepID=UPI00139108B6|nr:hypothetical protein [Nesterenkonia haasae]NDK30617.1 hypothetical protein [Nesterenkonia haasae]
MSAFDEIGRRADASGPETIRLLRQLGAQVTRTSSFPPPSGHASWSADAVDDLLADMFSQERRAKVFVLACYTQATDQASLERLILKAIRNFLIDQAKGTERGKLRRRLDTLLSEDTRFIRPPDLKGIRAWALLNHLLVLWQGDIDELHEAAARVRGYQILSWNSAGKTPRGTIIALTAVCHGVIDHADGSVRDEDLAKVVERRFALLAPPVFIEMPDGSSAAAVAARVVNSDDPWTNLGLQERAEELWVTLSTEEQSLLPVLGCGMNERRAATGLGRAATQALSDALADRLRLATFDDEDREEIVLRMFEIAAKGSESGRLSQVGSHMSRSPRKEPM